MTDAANGLDPTSTWETTLAEGRFEHVYDALEEVVARLEAGQLTLDESVAWFELGVRLAARCDLLLDEAELRVTTLELDDPTLDRIDLDAE